MANAVYDGTDAVMLSGETAQGKYPLESLQMMVHIIENTEQHLEYDLMLEKAGGAFKSRGIQCNWLFFCSCSGKSACEMYHHAFRLQELQQEWFLICGRRRYWVLLQMKGRCAGCLYTGECVLLKSLEFDTTEDICNGAIELAVVKQYVSREI